MTDSPLKGGRAIDPSQGLDARMDVAVHDGAISEIAPNIKPGPDTRVIKADGKLVTPGLIDLHTRVYHGVNQTGVDPDLAGVRAGVTTVVDAGSAGCYTFGGFPEHVAPKAKTRIIRMLHISRTGLSFQSEISGRAGFSSIRRADGRTSASTWRNPPWIKASARARSAPI